MVDGFKVAELAGAVAPWVIFSAGKPPERVLLQYTDVKYRKLVALWEASRERGRAKVIEACLLYHSSDKHLNLGVYP